MLTISTWLWGTKYGPLDAAKLIAGVHRNLRQPHRFMIFTDVLAKGFEARSMLGADAPVIVPMSIPDENLLLTKGCFARLRMFDPKWQRDVVCLADRLVCVDLDAVVTGPLDPVFDRPEHFVILQDAHSANPCPYNGSLMMLRPGAHPQVWQDFSLASAARVPFHEFPDDQGWIAHKVPKAAGWKAGASSGVYAFMKPGWNRKSEALPADARLVVFPGWRDPSKFTRLDWVQQNWRI